MNEKTNIFLLARSDYKENDELLRVLSKDYGLLTFVAKGSKKMNNKGAYLFPYNEYELIFNYRDDKDMYILSHRRLVSNYYPADADFNQLYALGLINEIAYNNLLDNHLVNYRDYYDALRFAYEHIREDYLLVLMLFISFVLKQEGVNPQVDHCVLCDRTRVAGISTSLGGFLCPEHLGNHSPYSSERLSKFRLINKASFKDLEVLKNYDYDFDDLSILTAFLNNGKFLKGIELLARK